MSVFAITCLLLVCGSDPGEVDERPAGAGEWGFRPSEGARTERTPPSFSWRPQSGAQSYELQATRDPSFERVDYTARDVEWNVHCPTRPFEPGAWAWRFRFMDREGAASAWSSVRRFEVPDGAAEFVLPPKSELLARIPGDHPRLFLRAEDLERLREAASGARREDFARLVRRCDELLAAPPSTDEPPLYEPNTVRGSDPWRAVWWGNRRATIEVLDGAANLAFCWRMTDDQEYGELARRLLVECARWDPRGATGYRYNDEAGMPYAYYFSRTYTLVHPLLSEDERAACREVMRVRGREMYAHLAPEHLWRPYSSHSNRAWHFLGEVGIAFQGEIPEAGDWVWLAANVFANVYPVWSDADGGWHEGTAYWRSYLARFTWWADVQCRALGLDAYALPFFSRAGDWAMYLMPPGTRGGGFGDQNAARTASDNCVLMTALATQSGNPYWRWYVEQLGGPDHGPGWVGFVRGAAAAVEPTPPRDLPTSRCFHGTGIAVLQSTLESASDNVEVIFKSSPFGSQSHGYEAQNSFLLYAFGERLLIRSGKRDSYGSTHHREWMWQTKSTNCITVEGRGQEPHSATARGRLTGFHTQPGAHWVEGEAAAAYDGALESFRRGILFLEPDLIIIHDRLRARDPATYEWRLHAPTSFALDDRGATVRVGTAACSVAFLDPAGLTLQQTDRFDTPPRERVKLVEHHLTATTPGRSTDARFVTVLRPYRAGSEPPGAARLEAGDDRDGAGLRLIAPLAGGLATVELGSDGAFRALVTTAEGEILRMDTSQSRF